MSHRYPVTAALIALSVIAGCGPRPDSQSTGSPAPAPENSGADHPKSEVVDANKRKEGTGFPDRLPAGLNRVVRGDTEVRVDSAAVGERLIVYVSVHTRGEKPLAFTDWTDPKAATVVGPDGKTFPLIPLTAEEVKARKEAYAKQPKASIEVGAGEVTKTRPRISVLQFEEKAVTNGQADLDLDGAAVGFTDPIRFRIPSQMLTPAMGRK